MQITKRLHKAIIFSSRAHDGQLRTGSDIPYITHPVSVACIVGEYTNDEDVVIAALFHDILEDVEKEGFTEKNIQDQFGPNVLGIVNGCTEKLGRDFSWKERKLDYIDHINTCSVDSLYVICADKIHNIMAIITDHEKIGEDIWKKFSGSKQDTLWFYQEVKNTIKKRLLNHDILIGLERSVDQLLVL